MNLNKSGMRNDYYLPIKPYDSGFLSVGGGQKIYYEQCGNPNGLPILYVHGGPGGGCDADDRRFFHSSKWRIVLYDQRGCGRSKPNALESIRLGNTTPHLAEDILKLLIHLGIERIVLFGGSWGTTLSLAFATLRPEMISAMILRGIDLGEYADIRHYITGGVAGLFPEAWDRFISHVPERLRSDPGWYYFQQMSSEDLISAKKYAYEWARYELSSMYVQSLTEKQIEERTSDDNLINWSILESWYINFRNRYFLPEGYILNHIGEIRNIPTVIVHGRYDAVCPLSGAVRLHQSLNKSKLFIEPAGHSCVEPAIKTRLINETNILYDLITGNCRTK